MGLEALDYSDPIDVGLTLLIASLVVIFGNYSLLLQSFPDGSLFNPKALFKRKKCTTLHMDEIDNFISDVGNVQKALAKILPPNTQYYVDAMKNESFGSEFYNYMDITYKDTVISEFSLHHKTSSSKGNCLTYSSSGSELQ